MTIAELNGTSPQWLKRSQGDAMGAVVRISAARDAQIIRVLRHYLALAEQGDLRGIAVCAQGTTVTEDISVAGVYLSSPALGVNVAMRMVVKLTQMQDEPD
jgi:hypothetical protein